MDPEVTPPPDGYEVLGVLGRGAMGVVYKARQRGLDRIVALKMLLDAGADPGVNERRRFQREIEVLTRLDHPGLVGLLDAGWTATGPYLAMPLVEGRTLQQIAQDVRLEPRRVLRFARELAAALVYVHERGILHRDIKPSNVMVAGDGRALLMDFGLALDTQRTRMTSAGRFLGTPLYTAPEIFGGADSDARTDLCSLAMSLDRVLTGRSPLDESWVRRRLAVMAGHVPAGGLTEASGLDRIQREEFLQAVPAADRTIAGELFDCIGRAMTVDPERRTPTAAAFVTDLATVGAVAARRRSTQPPSLPAAPPPARGRLPPAAPLLVLAGLSVAAFFIVRDESPDLTPVTRPGSPAAASVAAPAPDRDATAAAIRETGQSLVAATHEFMRIAVFPTAKEGELIPKELRKVKNSGTINPFLTRHLMHLASVVEKADRAAFEGPEWVPFARAGVALLDIVVRANTAHDSVVVMSALRRLAEIAPTVDARDGRRLFGLRLMMALKSHFPMLYPPDATRKVRQLELSAEYTAVIEGPRCPLKGDLRLAERVNMKVHRLRLLDDLESLQEQERGGSEQVMSAFEGTRPLAEEFVKRAGSWELGDSSREVTAQFLLLLICDRVRREGDRIPIDPKDVELLRGIIPHVPREALVRYKEKEFNVLRRLEVYELMADEIARQSVTEVTP